MTIESGLRVKDLILNREILEKFEIWETETGSEDFNMKEYYWGEQYITEDSFEELQDMGYEFKYVYSGQVLSTFDEFVDYMING